MDGFYLKEFVESLDAVPQVAKLHLSKSLLCSEDFLSLSKRQTPLTIKGSLMAKEEFDMCN